KVRNSDPAHLSFLLKPGHLAPAFFHVFGRPVDLVKIDRIYLQPSETVFAFPPNGFRLQVVMDITLLVPAKPALCKNVRPRSGPSLKCGSYNFLRVTHPVNGGGINPIHPELKGAV